MPGLQVSQSDSSRSSFFGFFLYLCTQHKMPQTHTNIIPTTSTIHPHPPTSTKHNTSVRTTVCASRRRHRHRHARGTNGKMRRGGAYQQHSIDAAVHFWVVGHLGILTPHHLARRGDQTQITDVHLHVDTCHTHTRNNTTPKKGRCCVGQKGGRNDCDKPEQDIVKRTD